MIINWHATRSMRVLINMASKERLRDERFAERAEIIREKGTNRSRFFRGLVDKYTWVDIGSSYLPGEVTAAFLWAQMQEAKTITNMRLNIWQDYHTAFGPLESRDCCAGRSCRKTANIMRKCRNRNF
jgi:dTDP-4-amino-4,6-dideoxygalactose transaminase